MRELEFRMWDSRANKYFTKTETVMDCLKQQLTGLYDHQADGCVFEMYTGLKDRYGVKIFEGDIVNTPTGITTIVYEKGCFYEKYSGIKMVRISRGHATETVIGSIHLNPELLEGGK